MQGDAPQSSQAGALDGMPLEQIMLKRRSLKRRLSGQANLYPVRIAVLGGSTTQELVDLLELQLLDSGFAPVFYQSEYGRFLVEAVHDSAALAGFAPDVVYLHTSVKNVESFPALDATDQQFAGCVANEVARFEQVWSAIDAKLGCTVIQNNFELPAMALLGNLDAQGNGGRTRFVLELNRAFVQAAQGRAKLLVQDVASLSARVGLEQWFDRERWFGYKIVTTPLGSQALAVSLAAIVRALYGRTRKVLVLDLDNTLWGGVIGDDGPDRIVLGRETAPGEAYMAFQEYCLALRERGVLLAVCSKNDPETARQGFAHPDSVLRLEHFASFQTNWEPKHESIARIAEELNLSPDSFVFVDDNPAERALVAAQVTGIAVPDVGSDVAAYPALIEARRYFEQVALSGEDVARAGLYASNRERTAALGTYASYGDYLASLHMTAEIRRFERCSLDRVVQLTNKTNQFNLTTRRYTLAEMEAVLDDPAALGLYGRMADRFGENGIVSVVLGRRAGDELALDLWLMSCRVLKREMEFAMLDALVAYAVRLGVRTLLGRYVPSRKNAMVADFYAGLGFSLVAREPSGARRHTGWEVADYVPRSTHIRIAAEAL